jgi:Fe2+ or Zn2+ uptake regulation protein
MLTTIRDRYVVECDSCAEIQELEDDFDMSRAQMKSLGWRAVKHGPEWTHLCPDCKED